MGGRWPRRRLSCSHASRRLLSSASLWSRKSARVWPLPLGRAVEAGLPSWPSPRQWTPLLCSHTQDGSEVAVKEVLAGDSVHSLLSILDVITVSAPPTPRARQPGLLPRTVGLRRRGLGGRASPQSWLLTAVGCLLNNCIGTGSPPHVVQDPKGPQRHGWKRPLLPRGTHLAPPGHCHGVALYGCRFVCFSPVCRAVLLGPRGAPLNGGQAPHAPAPAGEPSERWFCWSGR